jgi:hypothetical protein
MKDKSMELDKQEAAWEAHLAVAWRKGEGTDGGGEESAALARRLDAALRRERAERRAKTRWTAWLAWGAAAACAAILALAAVRGGRGGAVEVASTEVEEETSVAEEREAPVAEAFEELDDMLWEMASVTLSYGWDDEDLEGTN